MSRPPGGPQNVRLVAFVFPSNHFHLVAGFPEGNRAAFMRDFQGELSRRITTYRGCDGEMFPKPYHPRIILNPETLLEKISYTVNNTVRHGLVSHPQLWPGVESSAQVLEGEPLAGRWLDHNEWHNLKRRKDPPPKSEAMVEYEAELHVPECLPGDTEAERRQTMRQAVEEGRKEFCRVVGLERHRRVDDPNEYTRVDWQPQQSIAEDWCDIRKVCAGSEPSRVAGYLEIHPWTGGYDDPKSSEIPIRCGSPDAPVLIWSHVTSSAYALNLLTHVRQHVSNM